MQTINRDELKKKIDQADKDFHLIEVLGKEAFDDYHLPQAVNIPLKSSDFETQVKKVAPNKNEQIVVYCQDKDCSASKEAAEKIEALGYRNVKDFEEGKTDWKAAGYPIQ